MSLATSFTIIAVLLFVYGMLSLIDAKRKRENNRTLHRDYLLGLNFLLNEQPDKAVDVFIKMLEVDSDTVETHLALGKLFRKRGEVDRAIKVHQNLIARENLDAEHRVQSLLALGQDYLSAGVLDRAEHVFKKIIAIDAKHEEALSSLLSVYQQERAWENAIELATAYSKFSRHDLQPVIAHYYCEIAEIAFDTRQYDDCLKFANLALTHNKHCLRANLILAKVSIDQNNFELAIRLLQAAGAKRSEHLIEIIPLLTHCYRKLDDLPGLFGYINSCLEDCTHTPCYFALIHELHAFGCVSEEAFFNLQNFIGRTPSSEGLNLYLKLMRAKYDHDCLPEIQAITQKMVDNYPSYCCKQCGFTAKNLHWQCPSCRQWDALQPSLYHDLPLSKGYEQDEALSPLEHGQVEALG